MLKRLTPFFVLLGLVGVIGAGGGVLAQTRLISPSVWFLMWPSLLAVLLFSLCLLTSALKQYKWLLLFSVGFVAQAVSVVILAFSRTMKPWDAFAYTLVALSVVGTCLYGAWLYRRARSVARRPESRYERAGAEPTLPQLIASSSGSGGGVPDGHHVPEGAALVEPERRCAGCGAKLQAPEALCGSCGLAASEATTQIAQPPLGAPVQRESLGEFQLLRLLGQGGMGSVHEAWQESMRRNVALKVFDAGFGLSEEKVARFEREAWIGGRLAHPNIVKVFGQGQVGSIHFIAMELVEGHSLHAEIQRCKEERAASGPRSSRLESEEIRRVVSLFVGVADALAHVHAQGIVHRDIKPLNLLLTADRSRLLLTDFGLARDEAASRLTRRGDFMGTIRYMSPEQLLAHRAKVDARSDIYSLGVSIYEALTLDLPYSADSEEAYISAVSLKEPLPVRTRRRAVPRDLETILMKCLERDPERRYRSAADLRDDLKRLLDGQPIAARRPTPLIKVSRLVGRHRAALAITGVTTVVVVIVLQGLMRQARERQELQQIRWTLEQVLATQTKAGLLQRDWPRLEKKLHETVRRDTHGELARLARRASVSFGVDAAAFGLLSSPPSLHFESDNMLAPGMDFAVQADIEGSWDGGAWVPVGTCHGHIPNSSFATGSLSLDYWLAGKGFVPGPHRLALRAVIAYFDEAKPAARPEHQALICVPADSVQPTRLSGRAAEFLESRPLKDLSISLFDRFPEDFPTRLAETEATGPLGTWFRVDRVVVTCVRLPTGRGSRVAFPVFSWGEPHSAEVPQALAGARRVFAVVELRGHFASNTPLPIAADVSVWRSGDPTPFLRFPFALGPHVVELGGNVNSDDDRISGVLTRGDRGAFYVRGTPPVDGTGRGRIVLDSSRDIALETRRLDRYLGQTVEFPIEIDIRTVDGRWVEESDR